MGKINSNNVFYFIFIYLFILKPLGFFFFNFYLFIYDCVGSSFLCEGFL